MYLPGFSHGFGRHPKAAQKRFADKAKALRESVPGEIAKWFSSILPAEAFPEVRGRRNRVFDTLSTFWINLDQILNSGSLRWGNRLMQVTRHQLGKDLISTNTSAYCRARKRMSLEWIKAVHRRVIAKNVKASGRVLIVDGTSVQLPDTAANQDAYPQSGEQKPGCGTPIVQLIGLFEADSGMLVEVEDSPWSVHENALFQGLMLENIQRGDVLIADRAYCSFYNFHNIQSAGADTVMRLHQARKAVFEPGSNEVIAQWKRPTPQARPDYIDEEKWRQLPEHLTVRYIRYRMEQKGFRTREVILATTRMEAPAKELIELYHKRWQIELTFRDVKTTMGMEWIAAKSPELALKQVWMFVIAHNLIRYLINQARSAGANKLSFKGTLDTLTNFSRSIGKPCSRFWHSCLEPVLKLIAEDPVPERPGRVEPRCVKRRPKGYQLMTSPRRLMVVSQSRALK